MLIERRGFTIIELLIVTVIIGILAAIAIPTFARSKGSAYVATMKSDLRNLVTAQEAYFMDAITYYDGAVPSAQFSYNPSSGVSITLSNVTGGGWAAVTNHVQLGETCAMFVGTAPPPAPATTEGLVACS